MKRYLAFPIALFLLAAVWITGCSEGPIPIVPRDEPITVQVQSTETSVVRETVEETTSVPTLEPHEEDATLTPPPTPEATGVEPPAGAEQVARLACEDLAQRLGLAPEAIRLVSVETVEWSDASLGCPQPGMMYAQVITPGFRVVLEAEGRAYEYHTERGQVAVLCAREGHLISVPPSPTVTAITLPSMPTIAREEMIAAPVSGDLERLMDIAKQDLARRLGITADEIEVVHIERAEWPDTSLGCAEPGLARLPVAIPGYRIILSARGWEYVYHTGRERGVVYCPKG